MLVEVLLPGYRNVLLTYKWPSADYDAKAPQIGQIVMVTVRAKKHWGMIWATNVVCELAKILEVQEITDYIIPARYIEYMKKVAEYNLVSHSEVLMMTLVDFDQNEHEFYYKHNGTVFSISSLLGTFGKRSLNKMLRENAIESTYFTFSTKIPLSDAQKDAYNKINTIGFDKPVLIQGKTGSGKTNIYFKIIEDMLNADAQVFILMPEIALTKTFAERFAEQFNIMPYIWHSRITESAKNMIWKWSISGTKGVIIGSRSALWLPFSNLKCIVVDEEHDSSYKQENSPRYHARDMSVLRKRYDKCAVILVSATPSLETWFNVKQGKYSMVQLEGDQPIEAKIIARKADEWISPELIKEVNTELEKGNQCMLFLNRKGVARSVFCGVCSEYLMCPHCSANVILYRNFVVGCSYCGKRNYMKNCGNCSHMSWNTFGLGVDKIEEEAKVIFPNATIGTFTGDLKHLTESIADISEGRINLIISTQILAKGYNFMKLSLVAVLQGEQGLNSNDPRNTEHIYQLLTQVRGRCGRDKNLESKVFIQSSVRNNALLENILHNDFAAWAEGELEFREKNLLPPFYRLMRVIVANPNMIYAENDAKLIYEKIKSIANIDVFAPVPNQLHKLRSKFHYSIIIRYKKNHYPQAQLAAALDTIKLRNGSRYVVDVDPRSFV